MTRATATLAAAGFVLLCAGPAAAARPLAQAEAEAVVLSIGPESVSDQVGGPYRVRNNGDVETSSGDNQPQARLLTGQSDVQLGVLAQDATTTVEDGRGSSAACAGIAGDGGSLVAAGDGFCLEPGRTASLSAGALDLDRLADVSLVDGTPGLRDLLDGIGGIPVGDVIDQLDDQLDGILDPLGNAGLVVDVGAIQSRCTAGPGNVAEGTAQLTDVGAFLQLAPGSPVERITLLDFETNPAPNTNVATDLDEVVDIVVGAVVDSLGQAGLPPEVTNQFETVRAAVRENLTSQIADQLGPLDENLLSGTLNKQTRSPGAIEVTAVDLQVLPVLEPQTGFVAIDAQLGRSSCGPGGRAEGPPPASDPPEAPPAGGQTPQQPAVPRSVPAGLADDGESLAPQLALAALTVVATATGIAVYRRQSRP